ncbi:hypothetical protein D3C76_1637330 [compost metagenome]
MERNRGCSGVLHHISECLFHIILDDLPMDRRDEIHISFIGKCRTNRVFVRKFINEQFHPVDAHLFRRRLHLLQIETNAFDALFRYMDSIVQ